jgi:hypothetical protein
LTKIKITAIVRAQPFIFYPEGALSNKPARQLTAAEIQKRNNVRKTLKSIQSRIGDLKKRKKHLRRAAAGTINLKLIALGKQIRAEQDKCVHTYRYSHESYIGGGDGWHDPSYDITPGRCTNCGKKTAKKKLRRSEFSPFFSM